MGPYKEDETGVPAEYRLQRGGQGLLLEGAPGLQDKAGTCHLLKQLYLELVQARADRDGYKRITDKMPANFFRIGQIATILPNAKIIHCRRSALDTCLSCYKQNFARGQYFSYKQDDLAHYYHQYLAVMEYWREVLPGRFLEIDYEETVGNFEEQARKLIDHVELEWNDACLKPHKQKRSVLTASKEQVRKPIYKTSVEAFPSELGKDVEIRFA